VRAQQRTKDALFCALARMSAPAQRIRQRGSRRGVVKKTQAPWRGLARITRPAAPLTTGPQRLSRQARHTSLEAWVSSATNDIRRLRDGATVLQRMGTTWRLPQLLTHKPFAHRRGDV